MNLETKVDLILKELKNIFGQIDERFEKIDERFDRLENRFDRLENRFDNLENRFDKFEEKNEAEHKSMYNMLYTLNSAFLRFESENSFRISNLEQHQ